ncbi:MAG: hypothetical protein AAFY83_09900, partial [Pseudomonadota bacterium]
SRARCPYIDFSVNDTGASPTLGGQPVPLQESAARPRKGSPAPTSIRLPKTVGTPGERVRTIGD